MRITKTQAGETPDSPSTTGEVHATFFGATDVGRVRDNNEDAFLVADVESEKSLIASTRQTLTLAGRSLLFAVSDGMGGENAGEVASRLTLTSLLRAAAEERPKVGPAAALRVSVEHANDVVAAASSAPGSTGMGATLVAVLVEGDQAFIAAVGDSRVYLLRQNQLIQTTQDQTFLQYLIDSNAITPDQIESFPHKNVILQAVGRAPVLDLPLRRLALRRDDVLVLCSDGLTGEVDDEEIRRILTTTAPLDEACRHLIAAANAHGGRDNVTVVLATVHGDGLPAAAEGVAPTLRTVAPPAK
jgi:serine/threonine protein phosphatase PrpC